MQPKTYVLDHSGHSGWFEWRFDRELTGVQTVVVSSVFGELYSDDGGNSFQPSTGGGTSQSVRYLGVNGDGGQKFGVTGQYGNVQGAFAS